MKFISKKLFLVFTLLFVSSIFFSNQANAQNSDSSKECKYNQVNLIIINNLRWEDVTKISTPNLYKTLSEYSTASLSPGRTPESKDSSRFFTTLSSGTRTLDDTFDDYARIYNKNINSQYQADTTNFAKSAQKANKTISLFSESPIIGDEKALIIDKNQNLLGKDLLIEQVDPANFSDINIVSFDTQENIDERFTEVYNKLPTKNALNIIVGSIDYQSRHLSVSAINFGENKELFSRTRLRKGLVEVQDIAPTIFSNLCSEMIAKTEGGVITAKPTQVSFENRVTSYSNDNYNSKSRGARNEYATNLILFASITIAVLILFKKFLTENITFAKFIYKIFINFAYSIFISIYLVNVVERMSLAQWKDWIIIVALISTVIITFIPWTLFKPIFILFFLTSDLFLGNIFQANSAFGYSFISNSRSYGFSNYSGAAFGICALMLFIFIYNQNKTMGRLFAVVSTLIIALPSLGADVGGTFAIVSAFAMYFLVNNNDKIDIKKLIKIGLFSGIVVLIFGFIDFLRPAEERTHLGRTFDSLVHLEFLEFFSVIYRKLIGALGTINSVWFPITLICIAGIVLTLKKFGIFVSKAQLFSVGMYCLIGTMLNDAGTIFGGVSLFLYMLFLLDRAVQTIPSKVVVD